MEIEINFRFDENGRTANTKNNAGAEDNNIGIDYGFKTQMTNLIELSESELMDEILLDCEISDNLIMPRTYWMPADGTKARFSLEQFALDIFHRHVPPNGLDYDRESSGAEWWCQLRPSPVMGRHNAVRCSEQDRDGDDANNAEDPFTNGISFHVDKDEELRILTGGSTYVHPHISTITYLTDLGSPTLIMDCQVHPLTGEWIVPDESVEGFVSWPSVGKHTSFDGRYLHAAPPDLMGEKNAFQKQLELASKNDDGDSKKQTRRRRRVTFLVNVWLNYKPYDVHDFPESMINKMSGFKEDDRKKLEFDDPSVSKASSALHVQKTVIRSNQATEMNAETGKEPSSNATYTTEQFVWPLGDKNSKEELRCQIPMETITKSSKKGGNVQIQWQKNHNSTNGIEYDCFRLCDGKNNAAVLPTSTTDEIITKEVLDPSTEGEAIPSDSESTKRPRVS